MLARINSAQTAPDQIDGLVKWTEEQLPDAHDAPGFEGFYLLADRQSGKIVSISLWASDEDLRQFEARGARARKEATSELGIAPTPVDLYEVVLQG